MSHWLAPVVEPRPLGHRTLVVCRTYASKAEVQRHVAAHGGGLGLSVFTLEELIRAMDADFTPGAPEDVPFPPGHPWSEAGRRPRLRKVLAGVVNAARLQLLGAREVPGPLRELVRAGWGLDETTQSKLNTLKRLHNKSPQGPAFRFDQVFAVGFQSKEWPGQSRFDRSVLDALEAEYLGRRVDGDAPPIPCIRVPDTVAEVRWVAATLAQYRRDGGKLEEALVLVPSAHAASALSAALGRVGIGAAFDARERAVHRMSLHLQALLGWLSSSATDPVIDVKPLATLLWAFERHCAYPAPRYRRLFARLGLSRAPLSEWQRALSGRMESASSNEAEVIEDVSAVWQTLQDGPGSTHQELLLAVESIGLEAQDETARAALSRLQNKSHEQATEASITWAFNVPSETRVLERGCRIMRYLDYDHRPAELLLLTGLHASAFAAPSPPLPFITEELGVRLGLWGAEAQRAFRGRVIKEASALASSVYATLSQRDEAGHGTVASWGIELEDWHSKVGRYGLELDSPELTNVRALARASEVYPDEHPHLSGDAWTNHLATMASAEWARAGSGKDRQGQPDGSDLLAQVSYYQPVHSSSLAPWLGDVSAYKEAKLKKRANLSVSSGFSALSHCLYQAYGQLGLRLRDDKLPNGETDHRQVGSIVHEALEHAGVSTAWRIHRDDAEMAYSELRNTLRGVLGAAFEREVFGTDVHKENAQQSAARWSKHLERYIQQRVEWLDRPDLEERAGRLANEMLGGDAALDAAVNGFDWRADESRRAFRRWLLRATVAKARSESPFASKHRRALPSEVVLRIQDLANDELLHNTLRHLADVYKGYLALALAVNGPIAGAHTEWPFGQRGAEGEPLWLTLGEIEVQVNGVIDRVRVFEDDDEQLFEVCDFKTGSPQSAYSLRRGIEQRTLPQLPVYALALRAALASGIGPQGLDDTKNPLLLRYDYVRDNESVAFVPEVGDKNLEVYAQRMGRLVAMAQDGHFSLVPHAKTCPKLNAFGHDYCAFADSCRFARYPTQSQEAAESPAAQDEAQMYFSLD